MDSVKVIGARDHYCCSAGARNCSAALKEEMICFMLIWKISHLTVVSVAFHICGTVAFSFDPLVLF